MKKTSLITLTIYVLTLTLVFLASCAKKSPKELLDFQLPNDQNMILYQDIEYLPYGLPNKSDMKEQIGILNNDEKYKVYSFQDYPLEEFIIEYYESGLMDNPVLFRASDCDTEIEDMYLLGEEE